MNNPRVSILETLPEHDKTSSYRHKPKSIRLYPVTWVVIIWKSSSRKLTICYQAPFKMHYFQEYLNVYFYTFSNADWFRTSCTRVVQNFKYIGSVVSEKKFPNTFCLGLPVETVMEALARNYRFSYFWCKICFLEISEGHNFSQMSPEVIERYPSNR